MKCDFCGDKEAVVFVQQVIGNSSVDLHLCAECARSKGIQAGGGKIEFSVAGLLNGLFDQKAVRNPECPPCPGCGMTLEELQKSGRLGCARCAQAFQREILILMRKHVQSPQHRGKYPRRLLADSSLLEDRERLRDLLKKAVADEDYEVAATLRDRIKTLEGLSGEPRMTEALFTARWYDGNGPDMDVVLSSRARLARNLVDYPFPGRMARDDENSVNARVIDAVARGRADEALEPVDVSGLEANERRVLVEEGVISQSYSLEPFRRFAMTGDASLAVVPNDVDHMRICAFAPGLDLRSPLARVEALDDRMEDSLPYAATYELGFLCTELNSLGTGLRLSLLLHLPALSDTGLIEKAMKGVLSDGLAVRGFYGGEGQSSGALYQVSNAASLGDGETALAERIEVAARRVVQYERMAREELAEKDRERLLDKVARAFSLMGSARLLPLSECFELLSRFRLGVALGWIQGSSLSEVDGFYFRLQKASLQMRSPSADDSDRGADIDAVRAARLRAFAKNCALVGDA